MTPFKKGILVGILAVMLIVGAVVGIGATMQDSKAEPQADIQFQAAPVTQIYLVGDYFVGVVPLSEAGARALQWQVGDLSPWIEGVVYKRAEEAVRELVVRALQDKTELYLTKVQKDAFGAELISRGIFPLDYTDIPEDLIATLVLQCKVGQ